jgi:diguanylate cyclase (GGDEF)-like protein
VLCSTAVAGTDATLRWHDAWNCREHHVTPFLAQFVDVEPEISDILLDVLGDAGCADIDPEANVGGLLLDQGQLQRRLVVVAVHRADVRKLQRLATGLQAVPVLAICDEADLELAFAAGATQCVTRPLRKRELRARIRETMRGRNANERRANRERTMSDEIVALQREKHELERLVCVDALTGIANRRHVMELFASEWKRAARESHPIALVMVDLDCFHAYNEAYGHLGGDSCLQRVADAMVRCLRRPSDYLGRYGGEEFIAVLPNTDAVGAKIVAERMQAAVEALAIPHQASSCSNVVTITAGFASIKVLPDDAIDRLISAADAALLQAKRDGRNRVGGIAPLVRPSRVSAQRWERYAPVYVDPCFAERVPAFLDAVKQHMTALAESTRNGERRGGHAIRRLAQTAQELGLIAAEMLLCDVDTGIREGELPLLRDAAFELLQYVTHVQVIYRRTGDPEQLEGLVASC